MLLCADCPFASKAVEQTSRTAYLAEGPVEISKTESSVDGTRTWASSYGVEVATEIEFDPQDGFRTETTTHPDGTVVVRTYSEGRMESENRTDPSAASSRSRQHDKYGRPEVEFADGVTTTTTYIGATDLPATVTVSAAGQADQLTTYDEYSERGAVEELTLPGNRKQHTEYWPTGEEKRRHGSGVYDVSYTCDDAGRMETRTWARPGGAGPLDTRYHYNLAGELLGTDYSDSTPDVWGMACDGMGRLTAATDASGTRSMTHSPDGQSETEVWCNSGSVSAIPN